MTAPDVPGVGTGLRAGVELALSELAEARSFIADEVGHLPTVQRLQRAIQQIRALAAHPEPTPAGLVEAVAAALIPPDDVCPTCWHRIATDGEWETIPEGGGTDLCWEHPTCTWRSRGHEAHAAHVAAEVSAWVRGQREAVRDAVADVPGLRSEDAATVAVIEAAADAAIAALVGEA